MEKKRRLFFFILFFYFFIFFYCLFGYLLRIGVDIGGCSRYPWDRTYMRGSSLSFAFFSSLALLHPRIIGEWKESIESYQRDKKDRKDKEWHRKLTKSEEVDKEAGRKSRRYSLLYPSPLLSPLDSPLFLHTPCSFFLPLLCKSPHFLQEWGQWPHLHVGWRNCQEALDRGGDGAPFQRSRIFYLSCNLGLMVYRQRKRRKSTSSPVVIGIIIIPSRSESPERVPRRIFFFQIVCRSFSWVCLPFHFDWVGYFIYFRIRIVCFAFGFQPPTPTTTRVLRTTKETTSPSTFSKAERAGARTEGT